MQHLSHASAPLFCWIPQQRAPMIAGAVTDLVGHPLHEVERALILATLVDCYGNRTLTAKRLEISVRTLRNKLNACLLEGIDVPAFRGGTINSNLKVLD
jgi:DNA-binding NtrC family response regulator